VCPEFILNPLNLFNLLPFTEIPSALQTITNLTLWVALQTLLRLVKWLSKNSYGWSKRAITQDTLFDQHACAQFNAVEIGLDPYSQAYDTMEHINDTLSGLTSDYDDFLDLNYDDFLDLNYDDILDLNDNRAYDTMEPNNNHFPEPVNTMESNVFDLNCSDELIETIDTSGSVLKSAHRKRRAIEPANDDADDSKRRAIELSDDEDVGLPDPGRDERVKKYYQRLKERYCAKYEDHWGFNIAEMTGYRQLFQKGTASDKCMICNKDVKANAKGQHYQLHTKNHHSLVFNVIQLNLSEKFDIKNCSAVAENDRVLYNSVCNK
jgi:hypothetical protein